MWILCENWPQYFVKNMEEWNHSRMHVNHFCTLQAEQYSRLPTTSRRPAQVSCKSDWRHSWRYSYWASMNLFILQYVSSTHVQGFLNLDELQPNFLKILGTRWTSPNPNFTRFTPILILTSLKVVELQFVKSFGIPIYLVLRHVHECNCRC